MTRSFERNVAKARRLPFPSALCQTDTALAPTSPAGPRPDGNAFRAISRAFAGALRYFLFGKIAKYNPPVNPLRATTRSSRKDAPPEAAPAGQKRWHRQTALPWRPERASAGEKGRASPGGGSATTVPWPGAHVKLRSATSRNATAAVVKRAQQFQDAGRSWKRNALFAAPVARSENCQ